MLRVVAIVVCLLGVASPVCADDVDAAATAARAAHAASALQHAPLWPVQPGLFGGFLLGSPDPLFVGGLELYVPIVDGAGAMLLTTANAAAVDDLTLVDGVVAIGPAVRARIGDVRARAGVCVGALVHGFAFTDETSAGGRSGVAALLPVGMELPLGGGVAFTASAIGGAAPGILHAVDGRAVWQRDRAFVLLVAGVAFGGPEGL